MAATTTTTTWIFTATTTLLLLLSLPLNAQLPPASSPIATVTVPPPSDTTAAAPSPGLDCMSALLNLSDCLSYVSAGSNLTKPDKACCPELAGLVESNPICLCQLLGNPGSTGFEIDIKKATKLPDVCKVSTPPVSLCAAVGIPVGAPTASEPAGSLSLPPAPSLSPEGLASSPSSINKDKNYGVKSNGVSMLCLLTLISIPFFF